MAQLGRAYLAALAAALGQPPPQQVNAARSERREDLASWDQPAIQEILEWDGPGGSRLKALSSAAFVRPGQRGGTLTVWAFACPGGGTGRAPVLEGESKLHESWQSYAELSAEGGDPDRARAALEAFQRALAPHDVLNTPDGAVTQVLEEVLTDLCFYGGGPTAAHEEALRQALAGRGALGPERPELCAATFLLACLLLLRGDDGEANGEAGPLLARLRAVGPRLRFSHGVAGQFSKEGRLTGVEWREHLEPPGPFGQVGRALREI